MVCTYPSVAHVMHFRTPTQPILLVFLNKFDLLEKKLEGGLKASDYLTNYGDRPNNAQVFAKCTFPTPFLFPPVLFLACSLGRWGSLPSNLYSWGSRLA